MLNFSVLIVTVGDDRHLVKLKERVGGRSRGWWPLWEAVVELRVGLSNIGRSDSNDHPLFYFNLPR